VQRGLVIKSTGSWYYVKEQSGTIVPCKMKGKYRLKGIRATNPVAVGDRVIIQNKEPEDTCVIEKIEDRKNYIIRKSSKLSKQYQLIAANVDQALLMVSMIKPKTLTTFIDRFLVSAEAFRIPVVLVFNKLDLYDNALIKQKDKLLKIYKNAGYVSMTVSVDKQINLDAVQDVLKNKTSVISGNSGVGKTSLLNYLDPSLNLKTTDISAYHKSGQHTTTFAEMFFLQDNIKIIDTPGIKGFGTIDIQKEELFHFFPEIFKASTNCRFHNCLHINEPGCAVVESVIDGSISETRYQSYYSMMEDLHDKYRK